MAVAVEGRRGADDGPVHVAEVVEDGAAAGAAADEVDVGGGQGAEVGFQPGVLVAADYHRGGVAVEEEEGGGWVGFGEEVVLDGEV